MKSGIYKITNPIGQVYIGKSKDLERRFKQHSWGRISRQIRLLYDSIQRYGFNNHIIEVVELCSLDKLSYRERYWQEYYDVLGDNGLNCTVISIGEFKGRTRLESRLILRETNKGRVVSEETRRKMSEAKKGWRIPIEENVHCKLILNVDTGIYHYHVADASAAYSLNKRTLAGYLNGSKRNKTSLRYV